MGLMEEANSSSVSREPKRNCELMRMKTNKEFRRVRRGAQRTRRKKKKELYHGGDRGPQRERRMAGKTRRLDPSPAEDAGSG